MNYDEILRELKQTQASIRGLAAKAVINYLVTELEEIDDSIDEKIIDQLLINASLLINIEEEDISRVKELIKKLRN
ncbi:MAG: hypothetical protein RXN89_03505 [Vulcanisaeta sp.]|jgi:hypothetical protein|uniref:hypothetical protein n=1 Tax=Vulcanisaeta sp. EB80 TaxID=1650660 RepID=UPI0009BDA802|nr:hypothetical protein [Vulcanisaeta sp. EB80]MCG2865675.1 hypothetical protein [Vulcanisaeta sp.]MCG2867494.1 hypothetical protein [Vulcanisaeta sp.]MCG2885929.1 hypothetical protein [Vulcanisaeta sp.]MDT7863382.1 hypothetical protein [Vulcanisaeta sp.]PLC69073.1 hypothetical protein B7L70_00490 [Vulcanisaeta sp. EB80]